tara:strand:+ start:1044 stop:2915 length:1872 start_codon:yes stop_codon:yes gene_type:complete
MIPTLGKITPYEEQWEIRNNTVAHIREQFAVAKNKGKVKHAFIHAAVSSGKTIMMGAIANHCQNVGARCMILTDIGELCLQNSDECWNMDTSNSLYSNYAGRKSTHFNVIVGTVGTIANSLDSDFYSYAPHVLQIDECHKVNFFDVLDKGESLFSKVINHFLSINPSMVIIGYTGTPYRENAFIKGDFWQTLILPIIDRKFLCDNGRTVPDVFGYTENSYEIDNVKIDKDEFSDKDFTEKQLSDMYEQTDLTTTHRIMLDVVAISQNRNSVLITCYHLKHCQEAASVLPDNTWAIVTSKEVVTQTKYKTRIEATQAVKDGHIKYLLQVGCFTTGFNAPIIDHSVLLRPIMSFVLLEQLLGRGKRKLKPYQVEQGIQKTDHLVSDFSGTMAAMSAVYDDPMFEEAVRAKDKFDDGEPLICPDCGHGNGEHSRRCSNIINGQRCEYFWQYTECEDQILNGLLKIKGCGVKNDIAAKICRGCDNQLVDPNKKLTHKSYSAGDWRPVLKMGVDVTGKSQDGICVKYYLDVFDENGKQEVATVNFWAINEKGKRTWTSNFVRRHINGYPFQQKIISMTPVQVVGSKAMFDIPAMITHRINEKGKSIVHGLKFNSGKTMKGDKRVNDND